jgi:molybdopterin-guanine dinucleotide biosynthesis protein B
VDWVLVEGFKHGDLPKIEVWRGSRRTSRQDPGAPVCADPQVLAVATDAPSACPSRRASPCWI